MICPTASLCLSMQPDNPLLHGLLYKQSHHLLSFLCSCFIMSLEDHFFYGFAVWAVSSFVPLSIFITCALNYPCSQRNLMTSCYLFSCTSCLIIGKTVCVHFPCASKYTLKIACFMICYMSCLIICFPLCALYFSCPFASQRITSVTGLLYRLSHHLMDCLCHLHCSFASPHTFRLASFIDFL